MELFPYKRVKVTEGLRVKVSNHFHHSDFGVRDSGEMRYYGRRYVNSGTPGTGFIERDSESHSYHQFVRNCLKAQKPTYLKLVMGREPSYKREIERAGAALAATTDPVKKDILDHYLNALRVGRTEERFERIVRGIKDKIGHQSNKFLVSVMSHYKNKISQLGHDMDSVELHLKDTCSAERYQAYGEMVDAFTRVAACRRIWHFNEERKERYVQVHFDLGIFDFIRSEFYIPIMRDSNGVHYYLLPDSVVVARSTIVSQELAIEEPVEVLSSRLGDAASMIRIPELNLSYYFNHVRPIAAFVGSLNRMQTIR